MLWPRGLPPPHCLSKGKTLNPRVFARTRRPPLEGPFPFILAFWALLSFRFGLLGLDFLAFWPFRPWLLHILAFHVGNFG